jgi:phage shock protein C
MTRSFTHRIFGGVCGGIGAGLRLNPWLVRVLFLALALITGGTFAAVYLILWWIMPQASFIQDQRGLPAVIVLLVIVAGIAFWVLSFLGQTVINGVDVYLPVLAVVLAAVFLLRQLGGRTA